MNLIKQFTNSLWNFRSYKKLADIKGGKSFLYLFLVFTLIFLIFSVKVSMEASAGIEMARAALRNDVPDFRFEDGEFHCEGEMPYVFEDGDSRIIIDTTGATTAEALDGIQNGFLLTNDTLYQKSLGTLEAMELSQFPFEFSKDTIIELLPSIMVWVYIGLFLFYLISFAGKLFSILMLTLITMIATAVFSQKLNFSNQWNIALYAATLPSILQLLNNLSGGPLGFAFFFVYWFIAILYVFLAVRGIAQENKADAELQIASE